MDQSALLISALSNIIASIVSVIALFLAIYFLKKQKDAPQGFAHIFLGVSFEVLGNIIGFVETTNFARKLLFPIEYMVLLEITFLLLSFVFLLIAGLRLHSKNSIGYIATAVLSVIGFGINYYIIFVLVDGNIVSLLRQIYPFIGYISLSVMFCLKKGITRQTGFIFSGVICFIIGFSYLLKIFPIGYGLYNLWYFIPTCYVLLTIGFVLISNNILQHNVYLLEQKIDQSQDKLKKIVEASPFPIVISRLADDQIVLVNKYASEVLGIDYNKPYLHKTVEFFADTENRKDLMSKLKQNPFVDDFEVLVKSKSGDPFWMLSSSRIIDFDYDLVVYSAFQDINDRKNKEYSLFNQATTDALTRLYNRGYFMELAERQVKLASEKDEKFSVIMLDVDYFKNVNDTYGHKIGDRVLVELSRCCEKALRDTDIICRFGGEEFILLLSNTHIRAATKVAERLRSTISSLEIPTDNEGEFVKFTVSLGVAESSQADNIDDIIKFADDALYKAKQNGRNRVETSIIVPEEDEKKAEDVNIDIEVLDDIILEEDNKEAVEYFAPQNEKIDETEITTEIINEPAKKKIIKKVVKKAIQKTNEELNNETDD